MTERETIKIGNGLIFQGEKGGGVKDNYKVSREKDDNR